MGKSIRKHAGEVHLGKGPAEDVLEAIVKHHDILRECIHVLKSEEATNTKKRNQLEKFITWLRMHIYAEQETLYEAVREIEDLKHFALEGQEEHDIADALMVQLSALEYFDNWNDEMASKAKVLAELMEQHLDDEEREFFPEVRKYMIPAELESMRELYAQKCDSYLKQTPMAPFVSTIVKSAVNRVSQYVNRLT